MIHRFKCSSELNTKIMEFSDIHKYDDKDTLIQKFSDWIDTPEMKNILEIFGVHYAQTNERLSISID